MKCVDMHNIRLYLVHLRASVKRIRDRYRYCYRINGYSRWYMIECVAIEAAKFILG